MTIFFPVITNEYGEVIPPIQHAYIGTTVVMHCISTIVPLWTKIGGKICGIKDQTPVLILENVTEFDSGSYVCSGRNAVGDIFMKKSELYVGSKCIKKVFSFCALDCVFHINKEYFNIWNSCKNAHTLL